MTATRFIPTRRVRFQIDGGWRQGEVVRKFRDFRDERTLRVRDPLTGEYWDVAAADCIDISNEVHSEI